MANPTPGDFFVSKPLTSISVAYTLDQAQYYASRAFPMVPSDLPGGLYYKYTREDWFRLVAQKRAAGTQSAGGKFTLTTDNFYTQVRAVHFDIADPTLAVAGGMGFNLDRDATLWVTDQMLLERENQWVNTYFTTGVWGTDLTGVAGTPTAGQFKQWDQAGSTPIEDVQSVAITMAQTTGKRPNKLTIGPYVWLKLSNHAEIIDRVKYTQKGFISLDLLAAAFGVDEVLVPYGISDATLDGATASNQFLYGKSALLSYAPPNPSLMLPSAGYTFAWTGFLGAEATGARIKKFRIEEIESTRVEGESAYDMKLVAADCGTFFATAVA